MSIDPGTVSGWFTVLLLLAGLWVFLRGGGGVALGHLREANEVLTGTIQEQERKLQEGATRLREAEREISELRGRTDVSLAIAQALVPIIEWSNSHEQRAQERHEASLGILQLIADRLGPEEQAAA